jgi:hypothetical protein
LTIGSTEEFLAQAFLGGVPWTLSGGSAQLLFTDPNGNPLTLGAVISGSTAAALWTVTGPQGTWVRAWKLTDSSGIIQVSRPIVFTVISSPS